MIYDKAFDLINGKMLRLKTKGSADSGLIGLPDLSYASIENEEDYADIISLMLVNMELGGYPGGSKEGLGPQAMPAGHLIFRFRLTEDVRSSYLDTILLGAMPPQPQV